MKPTKPIDLSKKRDFDNKILRWQTKWSHSTDEKQVTLTETLQHANPDLYPNVDTIFTIIIHCSYHLSSHWLKAYSLFWETAQPADFSLISTLGLVNNL